MLTRIRIEVEGEDSAAATEEALTKYEHVVQVLEAQRHGLVRKGNCRGEEAAGLVEGDSIYDANSRQMASAWATPTVERGFYNSELGREVTDEVIEYDPSIPGYKGRRVVQFRRLDTRGDHAVASAVGTENSAAGSIVRR